MGVLSPLLRETTLLGANNGVARSLTNTKKKLWDQRTYVASSVDQSRSINIVHGPSPFNLQSILISYPYSTTWA